MDGDRIVVKSRTVEISYSKFVQAGFVYNTYLFAYVNPLYFNFFFIPIPNFYYFVSTCQIAQFAELKAEAGLISSIASSISSLFPFPRRNRACSIEWSQFQGVPEITQLHGRSSFHGWNTMGGEATRQPTHTQCLCRVRIARLSRCQTLDKKE